LQREWTVFILLAGAAVLTPDHLGAQWRTPWDYEGARGAEHWSELDPNYAVCNAGKEQSPIDIRNAKRAALPALAFDYKSGPLEYLINNGHTIRVNYHDPSGAGNFLIVGGKRYQLAQFHFHRPSEEYVNGKQYDMVLHLMHKSDDGSIAGVAVFLKAGSANSTIQEIWDHMPKSESKEIAIPGVKIHPAGMLPRDSGYYSYMGSLTAPPCTEGVQWFVLKTPIDISPEQISAFSNLYPDDVRPLQPLNGRVVKESQ